MAQELVNKERNISRAELLIHTAITLYDNGNFLCVVPLAAAADGSLGKQLIKAGIQPSFFELKDKLEKEYPDNNFDLNSYINSLKHSSEYDYIENESNIKMEAIHYLDRAINNFLTTTNSITEQMQKFCDKSALPLTEEDVA
jgi:hypothetical protein